MSDIIFQIASEDQWRAALRKQRDDSLAELTKRDEVIKERDEQIRVLREEIERLKGK